MATGADRPHDASKLPHGYSDAEIADLFPTIAAAAAPENAEDWKPEMERRHDVTYEYMSQAGQAASRLRRRNFHGGKIVK